MLKKADPETDYYHVVPGRHDSDESSPRGKREREGRERKRDIKREIQCTRDIEGREKRYRGKRKKEHIKGREI